MQARAQRWWLVLLAGIALQTAIWVGFRSVESSRARSSAEEFAYERVHPPEPVPELTLEDIQGRAVPGPASSERPVLLHFWATWCAPCRAELPSLLAYSAGNNDGTRPVLMLVSLDENWAVIRHHFAGRVPDAVVRDVAGAAARQLQVETLPQTLLIRPSGKVVARMRGARNWATDAARSSVAKLAQQ